MLSKFISLFIVLVLLSCQPFIKRKPQSLSNQLPGPNWQKVEMIVTAYCHCTSCCGWVLNDKKQAVYSYGKNKGKRKKVAYTSSRVYVQHGTIAADISMHAYGTKMYIPGYGLGVVEDIGGKIKGKHIDIYFTNHQNALEWGRKTLSVQILKPSS
ncbi:MAG: 3D domain-containing protein [Lentisphaeria bacterium]|nr:3D domain-containing protein [Lentisphaeria bacterium]NQZ71268.1 3D domain-containing protein [Lentisphaeria bacterium]